MTTLCPEVAHTVWAQAKRVPDAQREAFIRTVCALAADAIRSLRSPQNAPAATPGGCAVWGRQGQNA